MFFNDVLQRKLVNTLRPWLKNDHELQVKLGFFRSHATLNNLSFNVSALNELIDDPSRICFKQVTVEHLSLQASPFSSAAFVLQVRGLRITLSLGEVEDEEGVKWRLKPRDTRVEERNKLLAEIDPEGCAVHNTIQRIADITTRTWRTSLFNSLLTHCHLQMHDCHVLLQSPSSQDVVSCLLYAKELGAGSQFVDFRCFLLGLISSLFVPSEDSSFDIKIDGLEVKLNNENHTKCIVAPTNLLMSADLRHLKFIHYRFSVPSLNFFFSPADISVVLVIFALFSREPRCVRAGKQLWDIVASRTSSLLPVSNLSLLKAVKLACLWLRYVHTYQSLLQIVGYPAEDVMKSSAILMLRDKSLLRSVKFQWNVIAEIENDLPTEAIAFARQVVRSRKVLASGLNKSYDESLANKAFLMLHQLLTLIWVMVCSIWSLFMRLLFLQKICTNSEPSRRSCTSYEDSMAQRFISLCIGEISVAISPENENKPLNRKAVPDIGLSYKDLQSFRLSIESSFLRYVENISEECLSFTFGLFKVLGLSGANRFNTSEKGYEKVNDMQAAIWSEPAESFHFDEMSVDTAACESRGTSIPSLNLHLRKLWLNWNESCSKAEGNDIVNLNSPWIIYEARNILTDHSFSNLGSGFCSAVVGRLNVNMEYFTMASVAVILRQVQHALCRNDSSRRNVVSPSPTTTDDISVRDWSSKYILLSNKFELAIMRLLPQKHIQIGALIAGPRIQLSLSDSPFLGENGSGDPQIKQFSLDIHNIELLLSPNTLTSSSERTADFDGEADVPTLEELPEVDVNKLDTEVYSFHSQISLNAYLKIYGLHADFCNPSENQKYPFAVITPTTVHLRSRRKDHHSFGSRIVAFSAASNWMATGVCLSIYLDELHILAKVMTRSFYDVPRAFSMFGSISNAEVSRLGTFFTDSANEQMLMGSKERESVIVTNIHSAFKNTINLESFNVVLHNSRKQYSMRNDLMESRKNLAMHEIPGHGIYISWQKLLVDMSFKGGNMDVTIGSSGFRSMIFQYPADFKETETEVNTLMSSLCFLIEASVSHIKFCVSLRTLEKNSTEESNSGCNALHIASNSPSLISGSEMLDDQWIYAVFSLSEIYFAGTPLKDILVRGHRSDKFHATFSIGREFQKIYSHFKCGSLFVEATAVAIFLECLTTYYYRGFHIWSVGPFVQRGLIPEYSEGTTIGDGHPKTNTKKFPNVIDHLEVLSVDVSNLSLILVARDECGILRELLFEINFYLNHVAKDAMKKVFLSISKFSILSRFIHGVMQQESKDIQIHHFPSVIPDVSSSNFISNELSVLHQKDALHAFHVDARHSISSSFGKGLLTGSCGDPFTSTAGPKAMRISPQNYILKEFQSSVTVEWPVTVDWICPNQIWGGNGSVSGLDFTLSLTEIAMIFSALDSFSGVSTRERASKVEQSSGSSNQESEDSGDKLVADGAVVAIQDADQHLYIAVEGGQNGYHIVATNHYSLMGQKALFRVKYHSTRRWNSQVQYFSLMSLYAKDDSGESLRLNCRARSGLVEVSCSNDRADALWKMLPFKHDAYGDDIELEASRLLAKDKFYLENKKNGYGIAFVNGVLEFVNKPGNLFKWKVVQDSWPVGNSSLPESYVEEVSAGDLQYKSSVNEVNESRQSRNLSGIAITVEKITLTIVHELSDTEEKFPLLQGSIIVTETILQISNNKVRLMNTSEITVHYFDAQQNSWQEFIHPLEICSFYSSKFIVQDAENFLPRASSRFYTRIKELSMSVNEISFDILLFAIGNLNLAGPYDVRSSLVLANCCKVENQSGLTLLCQFYDNQDASVSARQSATIFLRHLALANQPSEASFFSIRLEQSGFLSTSPIQLSLLESRKFAWRTRIMSSQDSKSFSGPFIAVEISRKIEDGLSIAVSPLLRIHNGTDFHLELRFQRPQNEETDSATLVLKSGDIFDDSMAAFGAVNMSGGQRKALTSLNVGNFIFSFRPSFLDSLKNVENTSVEWSDDLKGGKPVRLSGIFDKLSYQVRKTFSINSDRRSLSTVRCALKSKEGYVSELHFLIQSIGKDIPVINPDSLRYAPANRNSPVALQEQKEVFLLPTVHVSNLLYTEIYVNLTGTDPRFPADHENEWSSATIPSQSAVNLYADPATIYFTISLTSFGSSCIPINSSDWVRKLKKKKSNIHFLDNELNFGGGKYFATLRLSRGHTGILKAAIFTPYALENNTGTSLFCFAAHQKPLTRSEIENFNSSLPPELGSYLLPNSIKSWFMKSHKVCLELLEEKASESRLDLDSLSGPTEIDLEVEENFGLKNIARLGVSLRPSVTEVASSQIVSLKPRYVVSNESQEAITIRQCDLEDDMDGLIAVNSKQRVAIRLKSRTKRKETTAIKAILRKHIKPQDDSFLFIQFRPNEAGYGWSGPICVASLGRFFIKFRRSTGLYERRSDHISHKRDMCEFAAVQVVEEKATISLHFIRPPDADLPYRIENCLHDVPITYYQKGSSEPEILGAGGRVGYVWDDLTLPHKLVIQLNGVHMLHEINLDKVRPWKSLYRSKQNRGLGLHLPLDKKPENQKWTTYNQFIATEAVKLGYEVYADGMTRVLRICEFSDSRKLDTVFRSSTKMKLRISYFAIHLLEHANQELDLDVPPDYTSIIIARLENIFLDSMFTDRFKYNEIKVKSFSVDEKWIGAPFSSMLRRHQSENSDNDCILRAVIILLSSSSVVKQVKYLSIVLQPLDFNVDEETLMKLVQFWRRSLSDSNTPRQQYYFDHFEIHPIKIVGSFLPGDSYSSYSSTQETVRSLIHSVIKIPAIKNMTVELNGVLVTHALINLRELAIKCAQHYSWYAMRAIYIAKGSPLLPPAFASIFDDLASSSLDVFFDPSSGLLNLPGVTIGTLKLIRKFVDDKGFSGTKRYFGDLGKTLKLAGSNILFAAVTEISDSVLKGAEANGINGMVTGFHHGILKLAMEPSVLGSAVVEGGPDRKIKLDRSIGVDELYIEGYLQAMLDTMYKQEYLRVRVIENQVILKNLPPNSSLIDEIMERVKGFLVSKALLKGDSTASSHSLRHIRGENEWRIGPTVLTLCEHLFVSFAIRLLRKKAGQILSGIKWRGKPKENEETAITSGSIGEQNVKLVWKWGIAKFVLSGIVAYIDGRLCRNIPNPVARRIVSGFLLSFLDSNDEDS